MAQNEVYRSYYHLRFCRKTFSTRFISYTISIMLKEYVGFRHFSGWCKTKIYKETEPFFILPLESQINGT